MPDESPAPGYCLQISAGGSWVFGHWLFAATFPHSLLAVLATGAQAVTLQLNAGENSTGQETIGGTTWNNLQGSSGSTGSLKYSDGSAASGISAT